MNWFGKLINKYGEADASAGRADGERQLEVVGSHPRTGITRVWAVGGGKGGVGKSLVTANFGIMLSRLGNKVLLVDVDLGAANLHTFFALEGSKTSLSSFLKGGVTDVESLISKTSIPNVELISGAKDSLDVADINGTSIIMLRNTLRELDYDYVLLDIGPGTSSNMLDLFLSSDEGMILTTPEPTSIENTYRFLKCIVLRRIRNIIHSGENYRRKELLQRVFSGNWNKRIKTVSDIISHLRELDPAHGEILKELMGTTSVSIIINQTRTAEDKYIGPSMRKACFDYFGVDIGYLGDIYYEDCVGDSIRLRKPLIIHYPQSKASFAIESCVQTLLKNENRGRMLKVGN